MNKNLELLKPLKKGLFTILILLLFTACGTTKHKHVETKNVRNDSLIQKRHSMLMTTISEAINDTVFLPIQTGDIKTDSLLSKRLSNFKTYKRSGANSYHISYNTKQSGFEIKSNIGKCENTLSKTNRRELKTTRQQTTQIHNEEITKYRIPRWLFIVWLLSLLGLYVLIKTDLL